MKMKFIDLFDHLAELEVRKYLQLFPTGQMEDANSPSLSSAKVEARVCGFLISLLPLIFPQKRIYKKAR